MVAWAPALRPHEAIGELLRARLNPNRFIHDSAVRWSTQGQHAIIKQLRANADGNVKRFGVPWPAVRVTAAIGGVVMARLLGLHGQRVSMPNSHTARLVRRGPAVSLVDASLPPPNTARA